MPYHAFFIFGKTPCLSLCELAAFLSSRNIFFTDSIRVRDAFVTTLSHELPSNTLALLGGTIKRGSIILRLPKGRLSSLSNALLAFLLTAFPRDGQRITFGISAFTVSHAGALRELGLGLKKALRAHGVPCRFVSPQEGTTLTSVQVQKNALCGATGIEFVLIETKEEWLVGRTHDVQDFASYSFRDYSRPHHDMAVGLLPPKLAQIMVNLASLSPENNSSLLDPFCGFGTVMQEALLMGYTNVRGSDSSEVMVRAAKENMAWLSKHYAIYFDTHRITQGDARSLSSLIPPSSIDAIITEPTLGPVRGFSKARGAAVIRELTSLYLVFYKDAKKILKPNGVIVAAWPVWQERKEQLFLPLMDEIIKNGYANVTLPQSLAPLCHTLTSRSTLLYTRTGQHIGREISVMRKTEKP